MEYTVRAARITDIDRLVALFDEPLRALRAGDAAGPLDAADLLRNEEIQVVNVNNGARFTTYVIPGPRGSGVVQLNGAAARLGMAGDLVILISYGVFEDAEARRFRPHVVFVDARNRITRAQLRAES